MIGIAYCIGNTCNHVFNVEGLKTIFGRDGRGSNQVCAVHIIVASYGRKFFICTHLIYHI